jgi:hypothetical protein
MTKKITKPRDQGNSRKRLDWEISRDRAMIAQFHYQGGMSDQMVADTLNARDEVDYTLTKRMIGYERKSILEDWREGQGDADVWVDEEILRIYGVEQEAWKAWERSMKPKERERVKEGSTARGTYEEVEKLIEGQVGDPVFLKIILECGEKRSRLRGLYVNKLQIQAQTEHLVKTYHVISPNDWDQLPGGTGQAPPQIVDGSTDK